MLKIALSAILLGLIGLPVPVFADDWMPLLKDDALSEWRASGGGESFHAKAGGLVWLRPVVKSVVSDDRWFPLHLSVQGKRVQVQVAEQLVVDYHEPDKLESGPRLRHGTLAIRGHGGDGPVLIRKLEVRPLADDKSAAPAPKLDDIGLRMLRLRLQGFPLVDFHTYYRWPPILDEVLMDSRRTGLGAGVVVPCGRGFPI